MYVYIRPALPQESTLRQPPPPGHRAHGGSLIIDFLPTLQDESNSERQKLTNIGSLPDDLVFNILVHLPAQYLYDVARLVCRKWYRMIHTHSFISQHLHRSTTGLLIQNKMYGREYPIFVAIDAAIQKGRIQIYNSTHKSIKDIVWASCNGLILQSGVCNKKQDDVLYITNPATKQLFKLPPILGGTTCYCGIEFAANSMEYKVVHSYYTFKDNTFNAGCAILTVGVDNSWRHVNIEHLSIEAQQCLLHSDPLATDGFMHWAVGKTHVLTLNVETEIITQTPIVSQVCGDYVYLSSEIYLSLLFQRNSYLWEVWEMKPETGEWMKLQNVDLEAHKCTFEKFRSRFPFSWPAEPVGWLKYGEVLVLYASKGRDRVWIAYNLRTKEIDVFELGPHGAYMRFILHRSSLVWLGGC